VNSDLNRGNGEKGIKAWGPTFRADGQAVVLALKLSKRPLRLVEGDLFLHRTPLQRSCESQSLGTDFL